MIEILLDTHIWLWSLDDAGRLGKKPGSARNPERIRFSPISMEALIPGTQRDDCTFMTTCVRLADATRSFREAPLNS